MVKVVATAAAFFLYCQTTQLIIKTFFMLTMLNNVEIDCPLQKVFAFIAQPENLPLWNYYLRTVTKTAEGNPFIGATYHQQRIKDEQHFAITAYEENKLIEFTSTGGFIKFKRLFTFAASGNGCIINDSFQISTYLPSFINKLIAKKTKAAVKENLLKLKQLLETGETILQDGRKISLH